MYINTKRRHDEDGASRREAAESAARLDGLRGQFVEWAQQRGVPAHEIAANLDQLDNVIENRRRHAERS